MKVFLSIAWRNVLRNKKRSLITSFAIAVGLVAMIFIWSIYDGVTPAMVDNMTNTFMGHLEISNPAYLEKPQIENAITDGAELIARVEQMDGIEAISPRLQVFGLFTYAENSVGGAIMGIDPEREARLGRIDESIQEGGSFLTGSRGVLLGKTAAKNLGVSVGDELLLVTSNRYNSMSYIGPLPIQGIVDTGVPEFDGTMAFVDRKLLAETVFIDPSVEIINDDIRIDSVEGVMTSMAIKLVDSEQVDHFSGKIAKLLDADKQVRTWSEMAPWFEQSIQMKEVFGYFVLAIILVIVVAGILNTVLMSVMERTREFGIMRSLGTRKRQIFLTVSMESMLLGLVGIVAGTVFGTILTLVVGHTGINLYGSIDMEAMGSFYILDSWVYPQLDLNHLISTCIIIMISVVIVAIYPARKAASMEPVEAIKSLG